MHKRIHNVEQRFELNPDVADIAEAIVNNTNPLQIVIDGITSHFVDNIFERGYVLVDLRHEHTQDEKGTPEIILHAETVFVGRRIAFHWHHAQEIINALKSGISNEVCYKMYES